MKKIVQKLNAAISGVLADSDVVIFVVSSRSNISGAQIETSRKALADALVGIDATTAATIGKINPVGLSDGESLRLIIEASLEKSAPETAEIIDEPEA